MSLLPDVVLPAWETAALLGFLHITLSGVYRGWCKKPQSHLEPSGWKHFKWAHWIIDSFKPVCQGNTSPAQLSAAVCAEETNSESSQPVRDRQNTLLFWHGRQRNLVQTWRILLHHEAGELHLKTALLKMSQSAPFQGQSSIRTATCQVNIHWAKFLY